MNSKVKIYRLGQSMTLEALAKESGVSVSTISDIERGAEPRVGTAILIARALHASVEELWGENVEM